MRLDGSEEFAFEGGNMNDGTTEAGAPVDLAARRRERALAAAEAPPPCGTAEGALDSETDPLRRTAEALARLLAVLEAMAVRLESIANAQAFTMATVAQMAHQLDGLAALQEAGQPDGVRLPQPLPGPVRETGA